MRKILIALSIFVTAACMDAEFVNQPLCTYVICGETYTDQVNVTLFNATEIDFEEIIWSIGGAVDTVNVLAFNQFSCWENHDNIRTSYLFALATAGGTKYLADTLYFEQEDIDTLTTGNFLLRLSLVDGEKMNFSWEEGYSGECVSF